MTSECQLSNPCRRYNTLHDRNSLTSLVISTSLPSFMTHALSKLGSKDIAIHIKEYRATSNLLKVLIEDSVIVCHGDDNRIGLFIRTHASDISHDAVRSTIRRNSDQSSTIRNSLYNAILNSSNLLVAAGPSKSSTSRSGLYMRLQIILSRSSKNIQSLSVPKSICRIQIRKNQSESVSAQRCCSQRSQQKPAQPLP